MSYELVDPSSVLNWENDWSDWLSGSPVDTIVSRQWTITPATGSPSGPTLTNATSATVTVSGCEVGKIYRLTEHITTAAGLQADRTIVLRCGNR